MNRNEILEIVKRFSGEDRLETRDGSAPLSYADLSNANLHRADLSNANLHRADLRYADLRYADLSNADLSYADLRRADLSYADLSYADLRYADLRRADLSYADLRYADLRRADLRYADLRGTCISVYLAPGMSADDEYLYVQHNPNGIMFKRGCFWGTETEFEAAVRAKHGDDALYLQLLPFIREVQRRMYPDNEVSK